MKTKSMIILCLIVSLTLIPLLALSKSQDTLRLDLALNDPGSVKSIQGNRSYKVIVLDNVVGGFSYSIEIKSTQTLLPPLKRDLDDSGLQSIDVDKSECTTLNDKLMNLKNFQNPPQDYEIERNEKNLGKIVNELLAELQKKNCVDNGVIVIANFWLNSTRKVHKEEIKIETGEKVTITVKRDSLEWTFIFNGNERGQWVTTYGFGFTSQISESQTYFTKQIPDTTTFQIQKSRSAEVWDLNYVPAIFFSYFPSQRFNSCLNHSLTAGLGFDLSAPVVFFGYSGLFYHNIGLSAGIAFQQQYRLKDQYSENEIISMTLDKGQLHDQVYRPNFFLSINFRFGENPFKSKNETDKE